MKNEKKKFFFLLLKNFGLAINRYNKKKIKLNYDKMKFVIQTEL